MFKLYESKIIRNYDKLYTCGITVVHMYTKSILGEDNG
jgi:hypothetical protein